MRTIRFVGSEQLEEYHGTDGGTNVDLLPGDYASVTEGKAEQLERDFPQAFEFDVEPAASKGNGDPLAGLDAHTRLKRLKLVQLIEVARLVDVENEQLEKLGTPGTSKDKVIETIAGMRDLDAVVEDEQVAALIAETAS